MSLGILLALAISLAAALIVTWLRRVELVRMAAAVEARERSLELGAAGAKLHNPVVDLSRCLGCGACVEACPEEEVLALVHGQAAVVHPARCVGVGECARACPVSAITVTIADLSTRRDVPVLGEGLEAHGVPGLFLAGEVTAHALVKTAIDHGVAVASEVERRSRQRGTDAMLDLCIVGAGPAGLACALEAKRLGLRAEILEKELELGGTVAKYPRKKLVLTQPVDLPLHGRLERSSYEKEDLVQIWAEVVDRHGLAIRFGATLEGITRTNAASFSVKTSCGELQARHVCLAIGRRGVPNRLGVPGEDLPKVGYGLLDAASYRGRKILVVGGGDSAIETALALAEQPGNEITISYRKEGFFRLRAANERRLRGVVASGNVRSLFGSEVRAIHADRVDLVVREKDGSHDISLANDAVFVMAGGTTATALLEAAGVSFDPSLRPPAPEPVEQGAGLRHALAIGLCFCLVAIAFVLWHGDYYLLPLEQRAVHGKHPSLRPGEGLGLWLGIASLVTISANLLYLLRRAAPSWFRFGSLQGWMTSHVATGILAVVFALLHGALAPRETPGGHALWALVVLSVTGSIGRYFYAHVPRATNGRELELAEVRSQLVRQSTQWDLDRDSFRQHARAELDRVVGRRQWQSSFLGRVIGLSTQRRDLRVLVEGLASKARSESIPAALAEQTLALVLRGYELATRVAHLEDLRAVLATWRFLHRWIAALMVLLVLVHVVHALAYGSYFVESRPP